MEMIQGIMVIAGTVGMVIGLVGAIICIGVFALTLLSLFFNWLADDTILGHVRVVCIIADFLDDITDSDVFEALSDFASAVASSSGRHRHRGLFGGGSFSGGFGRSGGSRGSGTGRKF